MTHRASAVSNSDDLSGQSGAIQLKRCPAVTMLLNTPKGRGIFATADIPARTVIDVSPVLVFDPDEYEEHVGKSRVWFYSFTWPMKPPSAAESGNENGRSKTVRQTQALPLGLGAMFNHASASSAGHNVGFVRDIENEVIRYTALRDVEDGEELCICYGDSAKLGFQDTDAETQEPVMEGDAGIDNIVSCDSGDK